MMTKKLGGIVAAGAAASGTSSAEQAANIETAAMPINTRCIVMILPSTPR